MIKKNTAPIKTAIFPVGGLGTRFLPATKAMPKEMLPVVDKPLIQYAVEEALSAGVERFIFVTGRGKQTLEDHFDVNYELFSTLRKKAKTTIVAELEQLMPKPGQLVYTRQQEPLGLGHAVWCARGLVGGEPFAVLSADDLVLGSPTCLQEMVTAYQENPANYVGIMKVKREHTSRYGIIAPQGRVDYITEIADMVEKPNIEAAPSDLAIIGRYILHPDIFTILDKKEKGAGGEIQLTDAMQKLKQTQKFYGVRFSGKRFDCGDKIGYIEANLAFALAREDMRDNVKEIIRQYK